MLQSKLFTKTFKKVGREEKSVNAKLLIRAGFIDKLMSGVYTFLPLGFKVLKKVEKIIREEMQRIGGQEIFMPALQPRDYWRQTGRWETMDDLFKIGQKFALGPTHEEVIAPLMKKFISTYRDLPLYAYQIQTKFRDESRAKSGLLRGREFIMKDLYSFHSTQEGLDNYYEKVKKAYFKIFNRVGLGRFTYLTYASGGTFSKYSHEFQTVAEAGEDVIYICQKCGLAINREIKDSLPKCPNCGSKKFEERKSIEVGNIFKLGTKYSRPFGLDFVDKDGRKKPVIMGCYGIGLSRVIGAVVEVSHDDYGIIWPVSIAPFLVHLLFLGSGKSRQDKLIMSQAREAYGKLQDLGIEVLFDEREGIASGQKLVESDLIGIPWRVIVSEKTFKSGRKFEIKRRGRKKSEILSFTSVSRKVLGRSV